MVKIVVIYFLSCVALKACGAPIVAEDSAVLESNPVVASGVGSVAVVRDEGIAAQGSAVLNNSPTVLSGVGENVVSDGANTVIAPADIGSRAPVLLGSEVLESNPIVFRDVGEKFVSDRANTVIAPAVIGSRAPVLLGSEVLESNPNVFRDVGEKFVSDRVNTVIAPGVIGSRPPVLLGSEVLESSPTVFQDVGEKVVSDRVNTVIAPGVIERSRVLPGFGIDSLWNGPDRYSNYFYQPLLPGFHHRLGSSESKKVKFIKVLSPVNDGTIVGGSVDAGNGNSEFILSSDSETNSETNSNQSKTKAFRLDESKKLNLALTERNQVDDNDVKINRQLPNNVPVVTTKID